jgi:hypothetical protein
MDEGLSGTTTAEQIRKILPPPGPTSHPVDIGLRSEAAIVGELLRRGYYVLEPRGFNHRYDLVIDTGARFLRVQCKTGRLRRGAVLFNARSVRTNTKQAISRSYQGDVDMFLVFCPDTNAVYAVPIEDATISIVALRVEPSANNQSKNIRWASDYLLPDPGSLMPHDGPVESVGMPE